jgi:hypothetical protein
MGYLKAIGLAAAAAALALSLSAGPAGAAVVEDEGDRVTFFRASDETGVVFHMAMGTTSCGIGGIQARMPGSGRSAGTVRAHVRVLALRWCRDRVDVLRNGELEIQASGPRGDGDGRLRSDGMRLTVESLGLHCVFETKRTEIGVLTGADATGYVATFDLDGALPRADGGVFCGPTAAWTAFYQVVVPPGLNVR